MLAGLGGGSKAHNDAAGFGRNPHGAEYGRCQVRFGKAKKGSPPKRRGVLTVFDWTRENPEHARTRLRGVLNWAMQGRHCPRSLAVPTMKISRRPALSEDERLAVLGRLLTDTEIPMRLRVAGVIALLYAQPLGRVVRLTVDDIVTAATPCCYDSASRRRPSPPGCWSTSLPAAT